MCLLYVVVVVVRFAFHPNVPWLFHCLLFTTDILVMEKLHGAIFQLLESVCAWRVGPYIARKAFNICQCG